MKPENFFQLNLPYGMEKDPFTNEWTLFNADHSPMGFYVPDKVGCERFRQRGIRTFWHHREQLTERIYIRLKYVADKGYTTYTYSTSFSICLPIKGLRPL